MNTPKLPFDEGEGILSTDTRENYLRMNDISEIN